MLAARLHGLGTVWTTGNMPVEREVAALLGIPYESVMQAAVVPVAHTVGTDFRPAPRVPVDEVLHWDRW
jgi:nitroreductase